LGTRLKNPTFQAIFVVFAVLIEGAYIFYYFKVVG